MRHNIMRRHLIVLMLVLLIAMLAASPILSRGDTGKKGGQPSPSTTSLLSCQKNNPDRLDCSSLEVTGICDGNTAVFTITNTGNPGDGNMLASTQYRLVQDGTVLETGTVLLQGGATMEIRYSGGGTVTLEADQQTGHPGKSQPQIPLNCGTPEPTLPPTTEVPPTEPPTEVTPTEEVTPPAELPFLWAEPLCAEDGSTLMVITNSGGNMAEPVYYSVTDAFGSLVADGWLQLNNGESMTLQYWDVGIITLQIGDSLVFTSLDCTSPDPTPTEEPTPPVESPYLWVNSFCEADGSTLMVVTNSGADMPESAYYTVTDTGGTLIADGWLYLYAGESASFQYWDVGVVTFDITGYLSFNSADCTVSEEPPTEVTPIEEPPTEVHPTEVTPPAPKKPPSLGCQKNNRDRLDCSSLEVTGTCDGNVAVFTITNTGEAGNGDMLASTQYRVIVDGTIVETGDVQLTGGATMEIRYSGGGTITLEADQQIGHPGGSQPQATLTCGG